MRKLLLCFLLLGVGSVITVQAQNDDDAAFPDYWHGDYDNLYDYDFLKDEEKKLDADVNKSGENLQPIKSENSVKKVKNEIKQFLSELEENSNEAKEVLDSGDYQVEDNRSKSKEVAEKEALSDDNGSVEDNIETLDESTLAEGKDDAKPEKANETNSKEDEDLKAEESRADYALLWGDDDVAPLQPPISDDKAIFDETQELLSDEDKETNDFEEEKQDTGVQLQNEESNLEEILDETKKLLAESENNFDDAIASEEDIQDQNKKDYDSYVDALSNEEDTIKKVQADLDEDFKELFDTLHKLNDDSSNEEKENVLDDSEVGNVLDYEEKYGKPYKEDIVLSQRADDDYAQIDDSNLSDIFADNEDTAAEELDDNSQNIEKSIDDKVESEDSEPNPDDDIKTTAKEQRTEQPIMYQNDALLEGDQKADSADVEEFDFNGKKSTRSSEEQTDASNESSIRSDQKSTLPSNEAKIELAKSTSEQLKPETSTNTIKTKMVDDLSSVEFDDLMSQFAILHSEDLDVNSDDFAKHVAPIHMVLSVDNPLIVMSPNYPSPYPTNNIVDWIFEGEGMGIELNITDFAVNGALGDYLLIKPGGVDDSGHDGLIFSYRLHSERRYRFTDVNRMFVRFEAKLGMMFMRGFQFSVRLLAPLPEERDALPEPEPILAPPTETITLYLGGVTLAQFREVKEEFRQLIADMATEYIRDNNVDPGLNTTFEITQITNSALCNIQWPDHETCAVVTFGVPLTYEDEAEPRLSEEDLTAMWRTYSSQDPFVSRLMRLGISEFQMPADNSVLTAWLVIATGVVISMALLAFALWRFSCSEDYTRMQNFSDTDSLKNEKRGLDLYPTPHQTLPPLYAESDYKWGDVKYDDATRVDMGGLANNSYVRSDMYDFDSDEDVVAPRDRKGVISPRDIYSDV